jgi:hypothetical protein
LRADKADADWMASFQRGDIQGVIDAAIDREQALIERRAAEYRAPQFGSVMTDARVAFDRAWSSRAFKRAALALRLLPEAEFSTISGGEMPETMPSLHDLHRHAEALRPTLERLTMALRVVANPAGHRADRIRHAKAVVEETGALLTTLGLPYDAKLGPRLDGSTTIGLED